MSTMLLNYIIPILALVASINCNKYISNKVENRTLLFGHYKSNLFHSISTKSKDQNIQIGLLWQDFNDIRLWNKIRFQCEQTDEFKGYGYHKFDPRFLAKQSITDEFMDYQLDSTFIKNFKDVNWLDRIQGKSISGANKKLALYFYVVLEQGHIQLIDNESGKLVFNGEHDSVGDFELKLKSKQSHIFQPIGLSVDKSSLWKVNEHLQQYLIAQGNNKITEFIELNGQEAVPEPKDIFTFESKNIGKDNNLVLIQVIVDGDFEFDITFNNLESKFELKKKEIKELVKQYETHFDTMFEKQFKLKSKKFNDELIEFSKYAFSNVIGGVSYFYGDSIIKKPKIEDEDDFLAEDNEEDEEEEQVEFKDETKSDQVTFTENKELLTAVPSRPFFPRGFLWDEGFHQLIISEFDGDLSLDVILSWYNLMDDDGWIAREQILGEEARSKVPSEFQTQHTDYANPPTLFMAIEKLITKAYDNQSDNNLFEDKYGESSFDKDILRDKFKSSEWINELYPKLKKQFNWFIQTQIGNTLNLNDKYNQHVYRWRGRTKGHCLTSGLDDYPRPSLSEQELHVDLLSWIGYMSKVLIKISKIIDDEKDIKYFETILQDVKKNLIDLHWSEENEAFCDVVIDDDGNPKHVCHLGYISLLPFILELLPEDSKYIQNSIRLILDEEHLWSEYGILSLSKQDKNFMTGEKYWKGPIWLNFNYLILKALNKYSKDNQELLIPYQQLRMNLINNVFKVYNQTGFIYESYLPDDGAGKGTHPFTGWSSLIVLVMAEIY